MVSIFRTKKNTTRNSPDIRELEADCMMRLISDIARLRSSIENVFQETDKLQWQMDSLEADHGAHIADLRAQIGSLRAKSSLEPCSPRNLVDRDFLGSFEPGNPSLTQSPIQTLGNFDSPLSGLSPASSFIHSIRNQQVYSPLTPVVPERDPKRLSLATPASKPVKQVRPLLAVPESRTLSSSEVEWDCVPRWTDSSGFTNSSDYSEGSPTEAIASPEQLLPNAYATSSLEGIDIPSISDNEDFAELPLKSHEFVPKNRESFNLERLFSALD